MAGKKTLTRVAGVSLAMALTSAVVPVAQAQETPTTADVTPSSVASVTVSPTTTTQTTVAPVVTTSDRALAELLGKSTAATSGTGTADAVYASLDKQRNADWTYTALARNPKNDRVYAISTGANGKPAGHLLRILAEDGAVSDLGAIKGVETTDVNAAAFTAEGELVLFDGSDAYTLDLSKDQPRTGKPETTVKKVALKLNGADRAGEPKAWTSTTDHGVADLLSVSTNSRGEAFLWTLDVNTGKADAEKLTLAEGVKLDEIGDLDYAYTQNNGLVVFADADGLALKVRGNQIVETDLGRSALDNFAAVSGLLLKSFYSPVTITDTPTPEPSPSSTESTPPSSSAAVAPSNSVEPSPSTSVTTVTTTTKTTDAKPAALWTLDVEVRTEDDKAVEGAEFKLTSGGTVIGGTRADGTGNIQIQLKDAPAAGQRFELTLAEAPVGYVNRKAAITPETEKVTFVLPRDPNVTTTNLPRKILAGIDEARPIVTSVLAPLAAAAAIGNAKPGKATTTRTSTTTSLSAAKMTGVSTGRSTSASTTARVASRNSTATARIVADGTSTSAVIVEERDDEELADTGTPMRAIIALGLLSLLVGAAYVALGRRREA